jgi:hypothetical protein
VAAILRDRFPYGNAVLIETTPQGLPKELRPLVEAQENPIAPVRSSLTCPDGGEKPFPEGNRRSLYLLYAHMQMTEALEVGDLVGCGAGLGRLVSNAESPAPGGSSGPAEAVSAAWRITSVMARWRCVTTA